MEEIHKVLGSLMAKEKALNDMIINSSLCLVKLIVDKLWKWNTLFVRVNT